MEELSAERRSLLLLLQYCDNTRWSMPVADPPQITHRSDLSISLRTVNHVSSSRTAKTAYSHRDRELCKDTTEHCHGGGSSLSLADVAPSSKTGFLHSWSRHHDSLLNELSGTRFNWPIDPAASHRIQTACCSQREHADG
jgi:hypothetical protein